MRNLIKSIFRRLFPKLSRLKDYYNEIYLQSFADAKSSGKATTFIERFREIVSDPLNILIERDQNSGYIDQDRNVILHNGIRVPFEGEGSYYERFSEILVINRGVHEPLEEYCFQQLISHLKKTDTEYTMLELGAYWGHYSLWFSKYLSKTKCVLVEPEQKNIEAGKKNFKLNGLNATFIKEFVSRDGFSVDKYLENETSLNELTLLHSDIQGYEAEMLIMCQNSLAAEKIRYLMISTHSEKIHENCISAIKAHNYCIAVDSEPKFHTTSTDGFIFAHRADCHPIINVEKLLGRLEIANTKACDKVQYLNSFIS